MKNNEPTAIELSQLAIGDGYFDLLVRTKHARRCINEILKALDTLMFQFGIRPT